MGEKIDKYVALLEELQATLENAKKIEDDIDVAVIVPEEAETGAGLDGVAFLVLNLDRKQGRAATIEDTHDDRFRQVLDHGLGEPERFKYPVGDFIFLE